MPLPGVFIIRPRRFHDRRGFFLESYNKRVLSAAGITVEFVQDDISLSVPVHTLRGLHFQKEPFGQAKLVSVLAGALLDVVVDLRKSSSSFGQHIAVPMSAENGDQLFVPVGFAHAFLTLEPDVYFA
jgi:dTDP-4-dehydrorhamnose 3,5-epimerase